MNDSHTEYHTVKEFLTFCVHGPDHPAAGTWTSTFPGQYLKGGVAAGGQLVDQRLLPRISGGEVRVLMSGDTCQMIIHKMPEGGGLSAVGGQAAYTFYKPEAVWKSTPGTPCPAKTSNLSISVKSKSFGLIFGWIVFSRRILTLKKHVEVVRIHSY